MLTTERQKKTTLISFILLMSLLLIASLIVLRPYLLTILMGAILALIARPLQRKLRVTGLGPKFSALTVTVLVCLLVIAPVVFFLIAAVDQAMELGKSLSANSHFSFDAARDWITQWKPMRAVLGDPETIDKQIREGLQKIGTLTTQTLLGFFSSLPDTVLQLFLAVLSCFFFLLDGRDFARWIQARLPLEADVQGKLFESFRNSAISSLVATVISALVQAVLMFITFLLLDIPLAFLGAGLTFIFAWVPFLGSMPVALAAGIYLYTQGTWGKVIAMIVAAVIIGVSDNISRPMVLRGRDEMHPLVSLVAIFGGIAMFGLFGVFFGPILISLLLAVLQIWPLVGARFGLFPDSTHVITPATPE